MSEKLTVYLKRCVKLELKWMYHYAIDDEMFGIPTDKYSWCKRVLNGDVRIESLLSYFKNNYAEHEEIFIMHLQEILNQ